MLPDNVLSSLSNRSALRTIGRQPNELLVDYELGGVALQDPSQGLEVKVWTLKGIVDKNTDEVAVTLSAPGTPATVLFSGAGITELSLAFDQNMRYFVTYVQSGQAKYRWYDPTIPGYTTTNLPSGATSPRCTLDDHRQFNIANSDIILGYIRAGNLCYRQQRDRYGTEYVLKETGANAQLVSVGMNSVYRLQFRLRNFTAATDGQVSLAVSPYLGDVVLDLCKRAGLAADQVDVSELYTARVAGYKVATDDDNVQTIKPLSDIFFFDPTEYDRKLHFFKRGRDVVGRFTYADLVQGSPLPMKLTRVDETKLPLKVNVKYIDPTGAYTENTQYAQRKSNQINTKNEVKIETGIVLTPDQAAQAAVTNLKMKWHEQMDQEFSLPLRFTAWIAGDVVEYEDQDGAVSRIRLLTRDEDGNELKFTSRLDAGDLAYDNGHITGQPLPPPISTTPGLIGETSLELLNIPVLRDQDDELGIYIGVAGASSAWYGAQILISTDGGINYFEAYRSDQPMTFGLTETELLSEVSAEYQDDQTLIVTSNFPLESTTYDTLLNNYNRAVVGDEIIQFQTALHLGDNRYKLSGLVRGRCATKTDTWPVGTRFVLLDSSIGFVQAQQWMLGMELMFKPVSYGTTEDDAIPTGYTFDEAASQTEWTPRHVTATRDGTDNVVVEFIPRPRLGIETAPYQSKYFAGYRVRFSDGFSVVVTSPTYTRAATPSGATVAVCGINAITGDGEYSQEIAT